MAVKLLLACQGKQHGACGHKVTQQASKSHGGTTWRPVTWKAIIIPLVENLKSSASVCICPARESETYSLETIVRFIHGFQSLTVLASI